MELTVLTPPELSAQHMPSMGARPTVAPWKARPLKAECSMTRRGQDSGPPGRGPAWASGAPT